MTIYKLDVNELADTPSAAISSYITPRTTKRSEYYLSKVKADARAEEIYDGVTKLVGYMPKVEVRITPVDVIERKAGGS